MSSPKWQSRPGAPVIGADWMTGVRPYLATRMRRRERSMLMCKVPEISADRFLPSIR